MAHSFFPCSPPIVHITRAPTPAHMPPNSCEPSLETSCFLPIRNECQPFLPPSLASTDPDATGREGSAGGAGSGLRDASEARNDAGHKGVTLQEFALRLLLYVVTRASAAPASSASPSPSPQPPPLITRPAFLFITRRFVFPALAACSLSPVTPVFDLVSLA